MSHADDAISNPSTGPSLDDVLLARYSRRQVLAAVSSPRVRPSWAGRPRCGSPKGPTI